MDSILKALRGISAVAFLAILVYVYAYLPGSVQLSTQANAGQMDKGTLFYTALAIFVVVALFVFLLRKTIDNLSNKEKKFKLWIGRWALSFMAINNLFLILSLLAIAFINLKEGQFSGYTFLLAVGPVLLVIWFSMLVFLFIRRASFSES